MFEFKNKFINDHIRSDHIYMTNDQRDSEHGQKKNDCAENDAIVYLAANYFCQKSNKEEKKNTDEDDQLTAKKSI